MATKRMFNRSVATIDEPEFINITSVNPLISKCEVKVLYVGENRNKSLITKEVATQMAQTLPGCPIVGYFREDKEDFFDHGDVVTIDGDGVKFSDRTRPYGFVAPDATIWFQKFIDTDATGKQTEREYLMTTAYLWTGQYPECQRVIDEGNPLSMKLDNETLDGNWAKSENSNVEFFIINDAVIQNLCILGEDVEPCFEGADATRPDISANFTKNNVNTLFTMMKELKDLLTQEGGQYSMVEENKIDEVTTEETPVENFSNEQDKVDEVVNDENQVNTEEFKKNEEEEDSSKKEEKSDDSNKDDSKSDSKAEDSKEEDKDKKKKEEEFKCGEEDKKKYELLETEYSELKEKYSLLETSYNELVAFKNSIEDKQKDELIASFYMLDDEDKKNVIENKSNFSLDDIEKELSVICVRKKVNFDLEDNSKEQPAEAVTTFNLDSLESTESDLPAWLKAVENIAKNR